MERLQLTASARVVNEQLQRLNDLANALQLNSQNPTLHQQGVGPDEHALKSSSTMSMVIEETSSTKKAKSRAWSTDSSDMSDTSIKGISSDIGSARFNDASNMPRTHMAPARRLLPSGPLPISSMALPKDSAKQQVLAIPQQCSTEVNGTLTSSEGPVVMQASREMITTTAMLRNIPFMYNEVELALELDELGFNGKYDLLYLPKQGNGNIGYAFVNLRTTEYFEEFWTSLHRYRFKNYQDSFRKKASVAAAAWQGYQANILRISKLGDKVRGLIL